MTNEELVIKIKNGDDGLLPQLWEQVRKFITILADKYYRRLESPKCDLDDLIQNSYFAVIKAVNYYDPKTGFLFTTFLTNTLKTSFREAIGIHTTKRDGLMYSISLDAPLSAEGDVTLLDVIGDLTPGTADVYETVVESIWNQELRSALDAAMDVLSEVQHEILKLHYYFGLSFDCIAEIRGCSRNAISNIEFAALRRIHNSRHVKILASFMYPSSMESDSYKATGYKAWKNTQCSIEERYLIRG